MTLQYETGTSTGVLDLLVKLADFITANGQATTVARNETGPTGFDATDRIVSLSFATPAVYCHFQSNVAHVSNAKRLYFEPSTGLSASGTPYHAHTGGYTGSANDALLGPSAISLPVSGSTFTYHFLHDDGWLYIALGMDGGFYQHAFAGQLDVVGSHAHGFLVQGMASTTATAQDYDSTTLSSSRLANSHPVAFPGGPSKGWGGLLNHSGVWVPTHQATDTAESGYKGYAIQGFGLGTSPTRYGSHHPYSLALPPQHLFSANFVQPLLRVPWCEPHVTLAGSENNMALVGYVPGVYATSCEVLPENEVVTIGTDDYLILPSRTRRVVHREQWQAVALKLPA